MANYLQQAFKLYEQGRWSKSEAACRAAVEADPKNAIAWQLLGSLCLRAGRMTQAIHAYSKAYALTPNDPSLAVNFASALRVGARYDEAITLLDAALLLIPNTPEAHLTKAQCLTDLNQHRDAEISYARACALRPRWPQGLEEHAFCLRRLGRTDEALALAKEALRLEPNRAACLRMVADYMQDSGQLLEAVEHYQRSNQINPNDGHTHNNLGLALMKLSACEEAVKAHRHATELIKNDPVIQYDLSLALLTLGKFKEGWPFFSARHSLPGNVNGQRSHSVPRLADSNVKDVSLFAWTDQGVGEEIMFAQLVPDLCNQGAKLTLECEPRLVPLFARSFPAVRVVPRQPQNCADYEMGYRAHTALADTSAWLRPCLVSFPKHKGYLIADQKQCAELKEKYSQRAKTRIVGLSWRTSSAAKLSEHKSVALDQWGSILNQSDTAFVSLQYGDVVQEIADANARHAATVLHDRDIDPLVDLDAFAAQVAAMDLVITTSSATAHMAGALGVPCWVILPSGTGRLWHWFIERDDSPWYPSVRLFRQPSDGDWSSVLGLVGNALADWHRGRI
jgi:Flp pilus assembly protein TadD